MRSEMSASFWSYQVKKLYFTSDFSEKNVKDLQSKGWILRNSAIESVSVEDADEYGGELPKIYTDEGVKSSTAEVKPQVKKD